MQLKDVWIVYFTKMDKPFNQSIWGVYISVHEAIRDLEKLCGAIITPAQRFDETWYYHGASTETNSTYKIEKYLLDDYGR